MRIAFVIAAGVCLAFAIAAAVIGDWPSMLVAVLCIAINILQAVTWKNVKHIDPNMEREDA